MRPFFNLTPLTLAWEKPQNHITQQDDYRLKKPKRLADPVKFNRGKDCSFICTECTTLYKHPLWQVPAQGLQSIIKHRRHHRKDTEIEKREMNTCTFNSVNISSLLPQPSLSKENLKVLTLHPPNVSLRYALPKILAHYTFILSPFSQKKQGIVQQHMHIKELPASSNNSSFRT